MGTIISTQDLLGYIELGNNTAELQDFPIKIVNFAGEVIECNSKEEFDDFLKSRTTPSNSNVEVEEEVDIEEVDVEEVTDEDNIEINTN